MVLNPLQLLCIPELLRNVDPIPSVAYGMRAMTPHHDQAICRHFQEAAELIAQKWMPLIVHALRPGPQRYSELKHAVPKISDASLSERLKALEAASIVERCVEPSTPVKVSYGLTPRGRELADGLNELQAWAERWTAEPARGGSPPGPPVPAGPKVRVDHRFRQMHRGVRLETIQRDPLAARAPAQP